MKITCVDKDVKSVLEGGYYLIPRFQRPYSWEREQVEEFWSDLTETQDNEHFIGSIVVYRSREKKLGVVDGQQRLTTITMILCALRNKLREIGQQHLANGVHALIERADISFRNQYILQSESSYPYFQEFIQKFAPPEVHAEPGPEEQLLISAFEMIVSNIGRICTEVNATPRIKKTTKQKLVQKQLVELRDRILNMKLIFIELDQEDDAYIIFETLNTRGKDLRLADLVKNHLTRLLKPANANVDLAKDKWNKMVETLEDSSEDISVDSFLHHHWLSQYEYTTAKKLFKSLRGRVSKTNARAFLDQLRLDAVTYRQVHEPSYRRWNRNEIDLLERLKALNLFRVKQDLPMILSVMREYREGKLKTKHVRRILTAIENFHFMFTAITSQRSSGGISFMYALHARELMAARDLPARLRVIDTLIDKLRDRIPSYQEFEANFLDKIYSSKYPKDKRLVQYVLARLDETFNQSGVPIDYAKMTIEHIAPENPSGNTNHLSEKTIALIGNLVLVNEAMNNQLSNKSFPEKKRILLRSLAWKDQSLSSASSWGKKEIETRSKALARVAYEQVWAI